jgi:hypothetical protein
MERIVGGCGHAVAVSSLVDAICTITSTGTLNEPDAGIHCRNNVSALECGEGPGLEL